VQVLEHQSRFADEDVRVTECTDSIEDVERPHKQQQKRCEGGPTGTSHVVSSVAWQLR
jgi:hypothetical protein